MNTKKVIEAAFVTCISVGYITASDPMAQNILENSASKQLTISTKQVRPVTRDEKVRKPIDIDPNSGLPILKTEEDNSNDYYEYFGEEENSVKKRMKKRSSMMKDYLH